MTAADDIPERAADWLSGVLKDRKKRVAIRRANTLEDFMDSWYVAALLGGELHQRPTKQLMVSLWGAATVKDQCDGSLARAARKHGISERHWQKLTSTRSREEAARQVRRIVRQLPAAPIKDVIERLFYWGPTARRRWAMEWFEIEEVGDDS